MGWDDLRALAADPLVTIGAHLKAHYAISKLAPEKAISEMEGSADIIERELGTRPIHFSFPMAMRPPRGRATSRLPRRQASRPR